MNDLSLQLLAEMIDETFRPTPVRKLPTTRRKAYYNDAVERAREKVDAALSEGVILPTRDHIRAALTDAALHIIATGGDGSETIRQVMAAVFGEASDSALRKVSDGKIQPKFFKSS